MGKAQPVNDYTALINAMPERERSNQRAWTDVIKKVHSRHPKLHYYNQLISAVREIQMAEACKLCIEASGIQTMSQASAFGTLSYVCAKFCQHQHNIKQSMSKQFGSQSFSVPRALPFSLIQY